MIITLYFCAHSLMFSEYSTRVDLHFATCRLNKLNPDAERI